MNYREFEKATGNNLLVKHGDLQSSPRAVCPHTLGALGASQDRREQIGRPARIRKHGDLREQKIYPIIFIALPTYLRISDGRVAAG